MGSNSERNTQLDFDFWVYTIERWQRAKVILDSKDFCTWLADAGKEE